MSVVASVGAAVALAGAAGGCGEPDDPASHLKAPPVPRIRSHAGSVVAGAGSYCWRRANEGVCADTGDDFTSDRPLVVRPRESVQVDMRIGTRSVDASLEIRSSATRLRAVALDRRKRRWRVALPAGIPRRSRLWISATYDAGDGTFAAGLQPVASGG